MARVKGRDVLLEMMEAVSQLQASSALHAAQMDEVAKMGLETRATVTALAADMRHFSKQVHGLATTVSALSTTVSALSTTVGSLSTTVGPLSTTVETLSSRVATLETEVGRLSEGFLMAATTAHTNQQHLARLAGMFNQFAGGERDRIDDLEDRVVKLERKAG